MPWWAIIYLVVFAGLCVAAVWDDDRDGRSVPFLVCSVLSHSIIVYLFIAFWRPALIDSFGISLAIAFVLAIGWQIFQTIADLRSLRHDPDLSAGERRVIPPLAVVLLWLFDLPAFIVAGLAALRG
jgi:hypothetical protein